MRLLNKGAIAQMVKRQTADRQIPGFESSQCHAVVAFVIGDTSWIVNDNNILTYSNFSKKAVFWSKSYFSYGQ